MAVQGSSEQEEHVAESVPAESTVVAAYETRPGRTVFTDPENSDAWIATDLTVDLHR
ncbi:MULTISPECIES: hypothetical protein [Halostella]|uniref:DUF7331 family protein n=1 Tax=Halostella TaxID=1843185 RepID=UPI00143E0B8E|nr:MULTISPECIES: hypothetical protein [Halostella]